MLVVDRLHVHRKSDGYLDGNLTLDAAASGFCAGGGHLYFLVPWLAHAG